MSIIGEPVSLTIETILFATDFSMTSEKAAAYAKALAHRFGSSVEITHVIDSSSVTSIGGASLQDLQQLASENLESLRTEFADAGVKGRVVKLESVSPSNAVLQSVKKTKPDLIVMGTSSKRGLKKLILGSTAEQVIRQSNRPVLTIGPNVSLPTDEVASFRKIVYATDFSPQAAKAAIYAFSFAEDSQAHLYLCHVLDVWTPESSNNLALERSFEASLKKLVPESAYDWCTPECSVEHGDPATAILKLAERVQADLIVLGSRKSSFWLNRVEEGVTPALLASAKCPVLTIS